ncbi:hypothetical protein RA11412_2560 [Rothia aeria]|uniref:Uncharacterized protein n=1 Tax=Rothia aeria TaxID=172042 RepID=A0A2Z5R4T7_9MICC|nr:hypothetical protein RA11412_2560 [Rothia aeria]
MLLVASLALLLLLLSGLLLLVSLALLLGRLLLLLLSGLLRLLTGASPNCSVGALANAAGMVPSEPATTDSAPAEAKSLREVTFLDEEVIF